MRHRLLGSAGSPADHTSNTRPHRPPGYPDDPRALRKNVAAVDSPSGACFEVIKVDGGAPQPGQADQ